MESVLRLTRSWTAFLEPYPFLRALQVILLFLVLAALVDRLISGVVRRIADRTETDLDDKILAVLHRPLFFTVALIGLSVAAYEFELQPNLLLSIHSLVQTLLVVIWLIFSLRFSGIVLEAMKGSEVHFSFVQHTTEPLLKNALAVLLFLAGVYGILLA